MSDNARNSEISESKRIEMKAVDIACSDFICWGDFLAYEIREDNNVRKL
jgi:hypothetical protein